MFDFIPNRLRLLIATHSIFEHNMFSIISILSVMAFRFSRGIEALFGGNTPITQYILQCGALFTRCTAYAALI